MTTEIVTKMHQHTVKNRSWKPKPFFDNCPFKFPFQLLFCCAFGHIFTKALSILLLWSFLMLAIQ